MDRRCRYGFTPDREGAAEPAALNEGVLHVSGNAVANAEPPSAHASWSCMAAFPSVSCGSVARAGPDAGAVAAAVGALRMDFLGKVDLRRTELAP